MPYAPIPNPVYLDATQWPYIKGPNYTRPVFLEHSRKGAFVVSPIVRMPSLLGMRGFGDDATTPATSVVPAVVTAVTPSADTTAAVPATTDPASSIPAQPLTPETTCSVVQGVSADVYSKCLAFNTQVAAAIASNSAQVQVLDAQIVAAQAKCGDPTDFNAWAKCFYGALSPTPWYENPWYLGGALITAAILLGLATQHYRRLQQS